MRQQKIEFYLTIVINNKLKHLIVSSEATMGYEHIKDSGGEFAEKLASILILEKPMIRVSSGRNYYDSISKRYPKEYREILRQIEDRHLAKFIKEENEKNNASTRQTKR